MKDRIFNKDLILCPLLGISLAVCLNLIIGVLSIDSLFPTYSTEVKPWLFRLPFAAGLLIYVIIAPLLEELIFRRLFFKALCTYVLAPAAGAASAVIFALYHGNAVQFIYAFIFGLVLSFVYWRSDDLLSPILLHAGANLIVWILYFLPSIPLIKEKAFQAVMILLSGIISFLILRYLIKTCPKKSIRPSKPIFPGG